MDAIDKFMNEHSIVYGVLGNMAGTIWREFGDSVNLEQRGIVSQYVSGPQAIASLLDMLEGQVSPQTVRQGNVTCILSQLSSDMVSVLNGTVEP